MVEQPISEEEEEERRIRRRITILNWRFWSCICTPKMNFVGHGCPK